MKISYAYYTNVGKVRKNNEDALLVMDQIISEESLDECKEGQQEGQEFLLGVKIFMCLKLKHFIKF